MITGTSRQDIPEGLAVAVAMIGLGYSKLKAFLVTAATGLVEVAFGFLGAAAVAAVAAVAASGQRLRGGPTFTAGAMLCIIRPEIIRPEIVPETHRNGPPQRPPGPGHRRAAVRPHPNDVSRRHAGLTALHGCASRCRRGSPRGGVCGRVGG